MIREYKDSDEPAIRAMHEAMGSAYPLPDLKSFVSVIVATDENDVPVQVLAARKTIEVFMLGDAEWKSPAWRLATFTELHEAMRGWMKHLGYSDAHAWLPPKVVRAFGKRLVRDFAWLPSKWKSYVRYL